MCSCDYHPDEDDETWRVEQVEDAMRYEAQWVEYQRVLAMRDSIDRTFTAMGMLPPMTTRRVRQMEPL